MPLVTVALSAFRTCRIRWRRISPRSAIRSDTSRVIPPLCHQSYQTLPEPAKRIA
ncbi:hypothetical protein QP162_17815 [Sphingomonas aurantiaca]|uniref:hypothetical protein n=1 Tax=Sphingomonas aurantiaca TaxID=185949 RepID=UPI002FE26E15